MLQFAIIFITLALIFYSIGVWSEKLQRTLKIWHVIIFWFGFVCDTTGTTLMSKLAGPGFSLNFHAVTGITAILLMCIHAVWATVTATGTNKKMKLQFHKFSIIVWFIWLIPYISGMIFGMMK